MSTDKLVGSVIYLDAFKPRFHTVVVEKSAVNQAFP